MRHTFASLAIAKGISIPQVAAWLGDDPKTVLDNYADVVEDLDLPE